MGLIAFLFFVELLLFFFLDLVIEFQVLLKAVQGNEDVVYFIVFVEVFQSMLFLTPEAIFFISFLKEILDLFVHV